MPVEYTVDSLDTVDESIRGAYVEADGKFNFDADKYAEIKAQGLKNKNKELIGKLKTKDDGLKRFEKFAEFDDDDLAELLDLREKSKNPPPPDPKQPKGNEELQANFDKALKKATDKHASDKAELEKQIADLTKQNKHFKLTVPLRQIALDAGVLPEYLELALLENQKRFELSDEDKIVVLDEDGDSTDIAPEKYFGELYKVQRSAFYKPSGAAGSGAPSSTGSSGGKRAMRVADWSKLQLSNPAQAVAFMKDVKEGKASLID